jgi:copper resistance protein D
MRATGAANPALDCTRMNPDIASVLLRAAAFVMLLQSGGLVLFLAIVGRGLGPSCPALRLLGLRSVSAAALLICSQYLLEAGRLGGDWASVLDGELQQLAWQGALGSALIMRLAALLLIGMALLPAAPRKLPALGGVALLVMSFLLIGHTREASQPWPRLALAVHLAAVAFWFGSLLPLRLVVREEPAAQAAHIVHTFSHWAVWTVALLFAAGMLLLAGLLPSWQTLFEPYGSLVLGKLAAFAVLLGLAALNKWRYAPRLASDPAAPRALRSAILAEYLLICGVLGLTAVLTSFFSP